MSNEKNKNPYLALIEEESEPEKRVPSSSAVEVSQDVPSIGDSADSLEETKNPYMAFTNDEDEKPLLENQRVKEAIAGAAIGAAHKARQMRADTQNHTKTFVDPNSPMGSRGLQSYLNSQINSKYKLPLRELERMVGTELRTMSEVQQALKFIQGQESQRVAKTITDPSGVKRNIYRITPGREPVDLSNYEQSLANKAAAAVKAAPSVAGNLARGAVAGAAGVPMAAQMYRQEEPTDWTQWSSLIGSGLGMTRSVPLGLAGAAMQIPYAINQLRELAKPNSTAKVRDFVNPLAAMAMSEEELNQPAIAPLQQKWSLFGDFSRKQDQPSMPPPSVPYGMK